MSAMDPTAVLTAIAALVIVSTIITATIRVLADASEDSGFAILFAPLVKGLSPKPGPVVREPEPTAWRFDLMKPRMSAPDPIARPTTVPQKVRSGAGFARP